jgi:hypothetical protein
MPSVSEIAEVIRALMKNAVPTLAGTAFSFQQVIAFIRS